MGKTSIEQQMETFCAVSDVTADAMCRYARSASGHPFIRASFEFEADFVVAEIMKAGFHIVRTETAQQQPKPTDMTVNEKRT